MKKRLLSITICLTMALSLVMGISLTASAEGTEPDTTWYNGTDTVFVLQDAADLEGLASLVNGGNSFSGKTVRLADNFDGSVALTTPIGDSSNHFSGTFDGNFKTVDLDIRITSATDVFAGMFGFIGSNATVKDLFATGKIEVICRDAMAGGIAGDSEDSVIINCFSGVNITAICSVNSAVALGGLVGLNCNADILNCYSSGEINAEVTGTKPNIVVGGVVGGNDSSKETDENHIFNCYSTCTINVTKQNTGKVVLGGVTGFCGNDLIKNCYASCVIMVTPDSEKENVFQGGIVGMNFFNTATISDSAVLTNDQMKLTSGEEGALVTKLNTYVASADNSNKLSRWEINGSYPEFCRYVAAIGDVKYYTFKDAVNAAVADQTIKLLDDVDEGNIDFNSNSVNIELNDHTLKGLLENASKVKFHIDSETDMNNAIKIATDDNRQTWEITDDFTISEFVKLEDRYLTINGNDHIITGASGTHADGDKALQMLSFYSVSADSRNNYKINNLKLICSERFKNVICIQNKAGAGKGIKLTLTNVEIDHNTCREEGVPVLNFGSKLTVNGNFKIKMGKKSCYAIGIDIGSYDSELFFGDDAEIIFVDGRTKKQKEDRALIFFSNRGKEHNATVSGDYVEKLVAVMEPGNNEVKMGYNLKCTYLDSITAGTEDQMIFLGGREAGKFTISGDSCKGYTLKNADGKYLAYDAFTKSVKLSSTAYTWKYDGGLYVEDGAIISAFAGWFKLLSKVFCAKYYLAVKCSGIDANGTQDLLETASDAVPNHISLQPEKGLCLTRIYTPACVQVVGTHDYKCVDRGDNHKYVCKHCGTATDIEAHSYKNSKCEQCGKAEPSFVGVTDVKVCEKKDILLCFLSWLKISRTTVKYQYTIKPVAQNVSVCKVEHSSSGTEGSFRPGSVITSDLKLSVCYIRITDSKGNVTNWRYEDGTVTEKDV